MYASALQKLPARRDPPSNNGTTGKKAATESDRLDLVISFIRTHPERNDDLFELAVMAHMSKRRFTSLFKKYTGLTIQEFRTRKRIRTAKRLLADPDQNIKSIAMACGFSGPSSFSVFFRRHLGMPPAAYRQHIQE